jgi:transcriptional regulator with XRE-family HTH domain
MADERSIGQRVGTYRRLRGMSQQHLADLVGVTRSYISMIEGGRRPVDKRETLYGLCTALQVSVADLTGQPYEPVDREQVQARAQIPAIELALMTEGHNHQGPLRPLATLDAEADQALRLRMQGQYLGFTRLLPGLLSQLQVRVRSSDEATRVSALHALIRAAFVCSLGAKELGFTSLAWVSSRMSLDAARQVQDPLAMAGAAYPRAQILLASNAPEHARATSQHAADSLQPHARTGPALQMYGMLHLQAALSSTILARQQPGRATSHLDTARSHLSEAKTTAARTGEGAEDSSTYQLTFGPTNVGVWELSLAMERDEPGRVHQASNTINPTAMNPNRLSRYYVEQGRAHARLREHDQALAMLLRAEHACPQYIRTLPVVRELVGFMVRDARRGAVPDRLSALARRCGAVPQTS